MNDDIDNLGVCADITVALKKLLDKEISNRRRDDDKTPIRLMVLCNLLSWALAHDAKDHEKKRKAFWASMPKMR